ncbi:P1 family peptidase [Mesorhizobium sp.]|uniref:P1 family peptidase n=1 Tax=Mesorhizobium sp. TaxID=1871066 RepID=UPI000FE5A816|nr:P1 family peptidase [Mesorhizobium sp.]RWL48313.1 MAG: peptidase S58 family protein [Mesorhizobium sp.]
MFRTGLRNLITDVAGLRVGNAIDPRLKSGVTVVLCDEPAVAGVQVLGGAPGTRETDLLEPQNSIATIHAVVLSGGSAFGLDAASGVQAALREKNIGVEVGGFRVPIVPAAILFDLRNGGDKDWGRYPPYRELGYEAVQAATVDFAIGTAGAGTGALTFGLKGGLGSASTVLDSGVTIGALAAVDEEFGGLGYPDPMPEDARKILLKYRDRRVGGHEEAGSTTIAVIATDAVLTKAAAKRLAISAHDGFAHAIWPTHTPADGDLVFALATGRSGIELGADAAIDLFAAAGATMARAISRGVHAATPADGDLFPVWSSR